MSASRGSATTGRSVRRRRRWMRRYLRDARRPTHCLLFLLPLLLIHEVGVWSASSSGQLGPGLIAHGMVQEVLGWVGLVGGVMPGLLFVAVLLIWRRLRRDVWHFDLRTLGTMALEGVALAIPLLVWSALLSPTPAAVARSASARFVLAVGAGLYEELVFRFLLISGLTWVLTRTLRTPASVSTSIAAGVATIVFAFCHFRPVGADALGFGSLLFRLVAGAYLSVIYLWRGLGVVTGCHVVHNLVSLALLR